MNSSPTTVDTWCPNCKLYQKAPLTLTEFCGGVLRIHRLDCMSCGAEEVRIDMVEYGP